MSMHVWCCCQQGCVLPATSDTLTVSIRNTNSCAGCYAGQAAGVYAGDVDFDADGDYTLTWVTDTLGRRIFAVNGEAINAGELRVHAAAGCVDTGILRSNGLGSFRVDFLISSGCMVYMHGNIDQAGDLDTWWCYHKTGSDLALNTWHLTDGSCGDELDDSPAAAPGILLSDATEMKVVID